MVLFKRFTAIVLILMMVFALSACHQQNESAIVFGKTDAKKGTAGRVDVRAALYNLYLLQADNEAKGKVDAANQAAGATATTTTNYFNKKIDKTDFSVWVKNRAIELATQYAAIQLWFDLYKLKITDTETQNVNYNASNSWQQGASDLCQLNGISEGTFLDFYTSSYKKSLVFDHLYAKGGTKAVSDSDIKKALKENYVIADTLKYTFPTTGTTIEADKKAAKAKLASYATLIDNGQSFIAVKKLFDTWQKTTADPNATATAAKDQNAVVYASTKSQKKSDYFDKIKNLAMNKVKVLEFSDSYILVIRKDIMADPFYLTDNTKEILSILKGDEFDKALAAYAKTIKKKEDAFVMGNYTPKKLQQPTTTAAAQQQPVS